MGILTALWRLVRMPEVVGRVQGYCMERHPPSVRIQSAANRVGAGETVEKIIRAAVLLKDDDDVPDLRSRSFNGERTWERRKSRRR